MSRNPSLTFFLALAKTNAVLSRRFDAGLGGLGFGEFAILWHLSQADGHKLRRIDLAEKIGLTASGVTRMLLPMEKIGLVKREANPLDARVSYVLIARGGKQKLEEALERTETLFDDITGPSAGKRLDSATALLEDLI